MELPHDKRFTLLHANRVRALLRQHISSVNVLFLRLWEPVLTRSWAKTVYSMTTPLLWNANENSILGANTTTPQGAKLLAVVAGEGRLALETRLAQTALQHSHWIMFDAMAVRKILVRTLRKLPASDWTGLVLENFADPALQYDAARICIQTYGFLPKIFVDMGADAGAHSSYYAQVARDAEILMPSIRIVENMFFISSERKS